MDVDAVATSALNVRFTMNRMCAKNNTYIYALLTRSNRMIMAHDLYRSLLPQCEALRTCCACFPNKYLCFLALGAKPTSHFLAQGFFSLRCLPSC